MTPDHQYGETAWERTVRLHEARLVVGARVRVLPRPECFYCRGGEDEVGLVGTVEHVGYRNYRFRSEVLEPGERDHIYWVEFPDEIPSSRTHHAHFAAPELIPLDDDA